LGWHSLPSYASESEIEYIVLAGFMVAGFPWFVTYSLAFILGLQKTLRGGK
jgi:hypothetical protein